MRAGPYVAPPEIRCTSALMASHPRHPERIRCSWTATVYAYTADGRRARLCETHLRYWAAYVERVEEIRICGAPESEREL